MATSEVQFLESAQLEEEIQEKLQELSYAA